VGFWSHHAMIDRIWYLWQLSELGMDPPPDMMSTVLAPFPMTVAQTPRSQRRPSGQSIRAAATGIR
jgi:tyrosinase